MRQIIVDEVSQAVQELSRGFAHFLPRLLVMLIIVLAGWIIAALLRAIVRAILRVAKFDRLSETSGAADLFSKAAIPSFSELLSQIVFWISWVGFILLGISALGIGGLQEHISRVFLYLPQIIIALLLVFFGFLAGSFLSRAVLLAAVNANLRSARLMSALVRSVVIVLAFAMAAEQLGLAPKTLLAAFSIFFGAIMLGLAIAFGLGGQVLARDFLEKRFTRRQETREKEDELSPL